MILIVDFGSQLTQLIARRIREGGRYCEILPFDAAPHRFVDLKPQAIILSGSGESTLDETTTPYLAPELLALDCPVLGICFGMQILGRHFGGQVTNTTGKHEFGHAVVQLMDVESSLLKNLDRVQQVWMSHGDSVTTLPPDFKILGVTENCPIAIMSHTHKPIFGLQFHPEVTETKQGRIILENFVSHCDKNWTAPAIVDSLVEDIRRQVGEQGDVLLALSGGVDSSVVACLMHRAIGTRLHCVMVDTGLLRLNEADQVKNAFKQYNPDLSVTVVDASTTFLSQLKGVADPEEKRKIIGRLFIECFEDFVYKNDEAFQKIKWLAQGTIYPDVIESAACGKSALIKTHHNVGLPEKMKLGLIEPIRRLFKDEVRRLGLQLGLPPDFIWRHPFPGPGLGIRVLGAVTPEQVQKLRKADYIFLEELRASGYYQKTSQAFAVLLPVRSVAVKGDARAYDEVISLRAIETIDFMTARSAELPYSLIKKVARRICNEVVGVSRVVYDLSDKPPGTIEWE